MPTKIEWVNALTLFFGVVWRRRADGKLMPIKQAWEIACAFYRRELDGRRHEEMP